MESPLRHSATLGRVIRQDGIATLGVSTQTLFERALEAGDRQLAADLLRYYWDELWRIGGALFQWLEDIVDFHVERAGGAAGGTADGPRGTAGGADATAGTAGLGALLTGGLARFDPSSGDRERALRQCAAGEVEAAIASAELMRVRYAALHDAWVAWIQDLIGEIAARHGEEAVLESVARTAQRLWRPRYAAWSEMEPLERLQLSVEGMRGHLSGTGRRGDVGIVEEEDRYVMVLDPCGSCGVLRRGDPDSGRAPADPAGTREQHAWAWDRIGVGWYAVHSAIVMEHLPMRDGLPPLRPLRGCDRDGPCRWMVYKDPHAARCESIV